MDFGFGKFYPVDFGFRKFYPAGFKFGKFYPAEISAFIRRIFEILPGGCMGTFRRLRRCNKSSNTSNNCVTGFIKRVTNALQYRWDNCKVLFETGYNCPTGGAIVARLEIGLLLPHHIDGAIVARY